MISDVPAEQTPRPPSKVFRGPCQIGTFTRGAAFSSVTQDGVVSLKKRPSESLMYDEEPGSVL